MNKYIFIAIGFVGIIATSLTGHAKDCKEIKTIVVEGKEFVEKGSKYQDIKQDVTNQCLIDAVKQALGANIRSNIDMSSTVIDDTYSDKLKELTTEKVQGYVDSYKIIKEDIESKETINLLYLQIEAKVCVPDKEQLQEIVLIGDILFPDGKKSEPGKQYMHGAFPKNDKYILISGDPENTYYDILITGKLIGSTIQVIENTSGKAGARIFGSALGGQLGNAIANSAEDKKKEAFITVSVQAENKVLKEIYNDTQSIKKSFASDTDDHVALSTTYKECVEKALSAVYSKLNGENIYSAGNNSSSSPEELPY